MTNLIETRLAGKTPRQKRTAVLPVNGHYSLLDSGPKALLRATTRVDQSRKRSQVRRSESSHGYTLTLAGSVGLRHP